MVNLRDDHAIHQLHYTSKLTQSHNLAPSDSKALPPIKYQYFKFVIVNGSYMRFKLLKNFKIKLTASSSISSSSSGIGGGLKKLKKLSHFSVLVIGLELLDPFLGFFIVIFCVKHFPGIHSISVLKKTKIILSIFFRCVVSAVL